MMGVHGIAAPELPLLLARPMPLHRNHRICAFSVHNFSINQPMHMASFLSDGRSFQFSAKQTFSCQQMKSPRASVKEDGSTSSGSSTLKTPQGRITDVWERVPDAIKNFPWKRFCIQFIKRMLDLFWKVSKWLAIPVLILSSLGEFLYILSAKRYICIPLGIFTGVMVARIGGETALVLNELQDEKSPWPLVVMGLLFVLLKLPGPYYPDWAASFFPHVANAGLVQTFLLYRGRKQMSA